MCELSCVCMTNSLSSFSRSCSRSRSEFRPLMQTETRARYTTDDLLAKSLLLRSISERVIDEELSILTKQLVDPVIGRFAGEIRRVADQIAHIDLDSSFALLGLRQGYTRPEILENAALDIVDGRHPVLDKLFTATGDENECIRHFTPNSLNLSAQASKCSPVAHRPSHRVFRQIFATDRPEYGREEHISPPKCVDSPDGPVWMLRSRFPVRFQSPRRHFHPRKQTNRSFYSLFIPCRLVHPMTCPGTSQLSCSKCPKPPTSFPTPPLAPSF